MRHPQQLDEWGFPRARLKETGDTAIWARVLSLTGALLTHMSANPEMQRFVTDVLAAGNSPATDGLDSRAPFDEPLNGLQTRELADAKVFGQYFSVRSQT
ncbi:MAG: hypothetical protein WAQ05_06960 [Rubrivivax sp.]